MPPVEADSSPGTLIRRCDQSQEPVPTEENSYICLCDPYMTTWRSVAKKTAMKTLQTRGVCVCGWFFPLNKAHLKDISQ